ncbi:MAG: transcriptional regulator [Spirochaetaceae bacterium]|nr:MAG: transcriptional regulator [Spirochaetaceae bacterium]
MEKSTCAESSLYDAAQKLKVCGHPVRLKLLCMIAHEEEPCVSELWVCLNLPQPVISQHLAVLKEKGIVRSEVQGNRRRYSIVDPFVEAIVSSLSLQNPEITNGSRKSGAESARLA